MAQYVSSFRSVRCWVKSKRNEAEKALASKRAALEGCKERGEWAVALAILDDLRSLGLEHSSDGEGYASVIAACEKAGEWGRAFELSEEWERAPAEALRHAAARRSPLPTPSSGAVCLQALQVGSHVGNTPNDPIFGLLNPDDTALFVEPVPELFEELVLNYRSRYPGNGFVFVNKAVSSTVGTARLYKATVRQQQPSWVSQLGSLRAGHAEAHAEEYGVPDLLSEEIEVETTTLNALIERHKVEHIKVLHTDAEGHDFEILMHLDLSLVKPELILFEHRHMDGFLKTGTKYQALLEHFHQSGYKVVGKYKEDTLLELSPGAALQ